MADDETFEVDVSGPIPLPRLLGGPLTLLDGDRAREMQATKTLTHNQKREKAKAIQVSKRREAAQQVTDAVNAALDSTIARDKTNEELADIIVQRNAKIVLLGGELFQPTTLREATDVAKAWSVIAKQEADRRRQRLPDEVEPTPVEDVAAKLGSYEKKMRERARQRAMDQAKSS